MTEPLIEVTVRAPIEEVWAHLREPALVRRWFGWDYDGLEGEIEQIFVEQVNADWGAHTLRWDQDEQQGDRVELSPEGDDATTLRLFRTAPEASEEAFDPIAEGWISFVQQLSFALARHRGEERRTLHGASEQTRAVAESIGAAVDGGAGSRYEASTAPAGPLSGEVWFRTEHQLGLTVEQLGDGLLVIARTPAESEAARGAASLTLSAFGSHTDGLAERWKPLVE